MIPPARLRELVACLQGLVVQNQQQLREAPTDDYLRGLTVARELVLKKLKPIVDALLTAEARPPQPDGWQPMETAPRDRAVWFWLVPKTADEAYRNTSGEPIVGTFAPYRQQLKYGGWSALSKALYWHDVPPDPPPAAARKDDPDACPTSEAAQASARSRLLPVPEVRPPLPDLSSQSSVLPPTQATAQEQAAEVANIRLENQPNEGRSPDGDGQSLQGRVGECAASAEVEREGTGTPRAGTIRPKAQSDQQPVGAQGHGGKPQTVNAGERAGRMQEEPQLRRHDRSTDGSNPSDSHQPQPAGAGVGRARPPLNRHSTREIVLDATGSASPFGGPHRFGHNPSWIKAADVDAALTALEQHASTVNVLLLAVSGHADKVTTEAAWNGVEAVRQRIVTLETQLAALIQGARALVNQLDDGATESLYLPQLQALRALLDAQETTP